jgi:hypothetical protein
VVGGSKSVKERACEGRRPAGEGSSDGAPGRSQSPHSSEEAGNDREAKGGRKVDHEGEMPCEVKGPSVPRENGDKQGSEVDLWQRYGAERGVWSPKMLAALDQGVKGNKWFSLIDKVYHERTLGRAWEKVRVADGAAGCDGITIGSSPKTANIGGSP